MFFMFGWGRRTVDDLGPTVPCHCPNCANDVWFRLHSAKSWFSLFMLPVLAYDSAVILSCPICSRGLKLNREQTENALALNKLAREFAAREIPEKVFRQAAEQFGLLPGVDNARNLQLEIGRAPRAAEPLGGREVRVTHHAVPVLKLVALIAAALVVATIFLWSSYGAVR